MWVSWKCVLDAAQDPYAMSVCYENLGPGSRTKLDDETRTE